MLLIKKPNLIPEKKLRINMPKWNVNKCSRIIKSIKRINLAIYYKEIINKKTNLVIYSLGNDIPEKF